MDFPKAETHKDAAQWRRAAWVAALIALAAYAEILGLHIGAVAGGSDSSGYMNNAKLVAAGQLHAQPRTIPGLPVSQVAPFLYIPLGFRPAWNGAGMVPTYPIGLSLFIVAVKAVVGWRYAGDVTLLLHALAGILATYCLGRAGGLSRPWSGLCAAVVALSPLYIFMSLQAMSDVPSLAWTTFAVLASLKARDRPSWALAAGASLAVDVLLRPANVLAFLPVLVALGASPRRWLGLALGGLPGAILFFAYNAAAYGGLAVTGYGDSLDSFGAALVPGTAAQYLRWMPVLFTPAILLIPALPFLAGVPPRTRLMLTLWVVAFAGFYSAYQFTHESWWYLRYLLPMAPALVVGSALALRALLTRLKGLSALARSPVAFVAVLGLVSASSIWWCDDLNALHIGEEELRYGLIADWMRVNMPPDAVCLSMQASGSIYFYTPFTLVRWDMLKDADMPKVKSALATTKRPLYAVVFPFESERMKALGLSYGGAWNPVGKVDDVVILQHSSGPPLP